MITVIIKGEVNLVNKTKMESIKYLGTPEKIITPGVHVLKNMLAKG